MNKPVLKYTTNDESCSAIMAIPAVHRLGFSMLALVVKRVCEVIHAVKRVWVALS